METGLYDTMYPGKITRDAELSGPRTGREKRARGFHVTHQLHAATLDNGPTSNFIAFLISFV